MRKASTPFRWISTAASGLTPWLSKSLSAVRTGVGPVETTSPMRQQLSADNAPISGTCVVDSPWLFSEVLFCLEQVAFRAAASLRRFAFLTIFVWRSQSLLH